MKKVLAAAWPIMLSYVTIGIPCGVLGAKCGIGAGQGFLLSVTVISGAGQFMINNLWLAGMPAATIAASVAAISLRFSLYSASLAPHLRQASKKMTLALSCTLIEEAYGVTMDKLTGNDESWTLHHALALNVVTILTWACSVAAGAALGGVVNIPTAVASFAMTSMFIYLLWAQLSSRRNAVAAAGAAAVVVVCKAVGLDTVAVPLGAVVGVAAALLAGPGGAGGMDTLDGSAAGEKRPQNGGDAA